MLNISPILAQKLNNNSTNNTTVDNYAQVQTKPMPNDKFEKSNKSKKGLIVAGSIGASLVAFGGFVMLAKKGKLGEGCKEFVDKIFKSNKSKVQSNVPDATILPQKVDNGIDNIANNAGKLNEISDEITGATSKPTKKIYDIAFQRDLDLQNSYKPRETLIGNIEEYKVYDEPLERLLVTKKNIPLESATKLEQYALTPYDVPTNFMISAYETQAKKGSALIVDKVPDMFDGI